ncbi:unnamed protein product [Urochloa humidicola]
MMAEFQFSLRKQPVLPRCPPPGRPARRVLRPRSRPPRSPRLGGRRSRCIAPRAATSPRRGHPVAGDWKVSEDTACVLALPVADARAVDDVLHVQHAPIQIRPPRASVSPSPTGAPLVTSRVRLRRRAAEIRRPDLVCVYWIRIVLRAAEVEAPISW